MKLPVTYIAVCNPHTVYWQDTIYKDMGIIVLTF